MIKKTLLIVLLATLVACSSKPSSFELGEETLPPYGCIEYRLRGGEC